MAGRARFEAELSRSLSAGQLRLHLLPLVDLSGQLLGAEMLLRWQHPQRGLLKPEDFMRVAEETGLIGPIGAWVLEAACQQLVRWAGEPGRANLRLSVNISLVQFLQEGFLSELVGLLAASPFQPSRLALEFSEKCSITTLALWPTKWPRWRTLGCASPWTTLVPACHP